MKVFINRKIRRTPWGGGIHFVSGFCDYLASNGHSYTNSFDNDVDVILMIDPRPDDGFGDINSLINYKSHLKSIGKKVKVVHRVNDSDVPRGTNFLVRLNIESNAAVADQTVFISEWLKDHYVERGFSRDNVVIRNGSNNDFFYPTKIVNDDKIKIVTHHWSDNYNKGFDAYVELDKLIKHEQNMEFTYIGRYWSGHKPVNTRVISPLYGKELGDELRKHNVYVTAARWEACGMHHIEAAACGLPIAYHKDGGGIVEMCKNYGVQFDTASDVIAAIKETFIRRKELVSCIDYDSLNNNSVYQKYVSIMI